MTLYCLHGYQTITSEDFLVISNNKGEYQLCGVTLDGQSSKPNPIPKPNSIPWYRYYTLGPNRGIALSPEKILLLVDGRKKASVNHNWEGIHDLYMLLLHRETDKMLSLEDKHDDRARSFWPKIKAYLDSIPAANEDAREIQRAMQKWESVSMQTLRWLEKEIGIPNLSYGKTEVLISGTRWLVHYRYENRLVMGNEKSVWGEVRIPQKRQEIRLATPIKDGWIIKATEDDWLLQRKNNNTVELQEIICPVGKWQRFGPWTGWGADRVILTPVGRMIITPSDAFLHAATSRWAFFHVSERQWIIINQLGEIFTEEMPEQYDDWVTLEAGDSDVLIIHRKDKCCYFSMIPEFDLPFPSHSWEIKAFPRHTTIRADVIRGNSDIFVVLFQPYFKQGLGICLINAKREAWWSLCPLEIPYLLTPVLFKDQGGGRMIIELPKIAERPIEIKLEVIDGWVRLDAGVGAILTGEMARLPDRPGDTLLRALMSLFE